MPGNTGPPSRAQCVGSERVVDWGGGGPGGAEGMVVVGVGEMAAGAV